MLLLDQLLRRLVREGPLTVIDHRGREHVYGQPDPAVRPVAIRLHTAAIERARIIAERQIEFFSMIVEPVKPESSQEPRRLLMISLIAGGAGLAFALAVVTRKYFA